MTGIENETLKLGTKQEQAELLHRVLATTDEDALEERIPIDPDSLSIGNKGYFGRYKSAQMASLSGADDAVYVDTSSANSQKDKLKDRHPLFRLFRR